MVAARFFDIPFALDGDLSAVPDTVQSNGSVSYPQGYGINYSTAVASGGLNFPRAQHNQLLFDITNTLQQYQMNGVPLFYAGMSVAPFTGYPKYARVLQPDGNVYISLIADNTDVPPSSNWQIANAGTGIPENAEAGSTYAPDAGDSGKIIVRSDSGSNMTDTLPGTAGALGASWYAYYGNSDASGIVTVGVGSGGTIAVGKQATANKFNVAPGDMWLVISLGSGNYIANRIASAVLHAAPVKSSYSNLSIQWTSNTGISLTADEIIVEDSSGDTRKISSASFAINTATSGVGGMSSGPIAASTPYYLHAVLNPATGAKGAILDVSKTAPTLPTGFTMWAWLGFDYSDASSHLLGFQQKDNEWQYIVGENQATAAILASGTAGSVTTPTYASASLTGVVPTGDVSMIHMFIGINNTGSTGIIMMAPNASYGAYNSTTNPPMCVFQNSSQAGVDPFDMLLQSGVTTVQYASSSTGGFIGVFGFRLNL